MPDGGLLTLTVEGRAYGGWQAVTVSRSIERTAGSFDLDLTERWAGQSLRRPILPGHACSLAIDGEVVLTGYVDDVEAGYDASSHSLRVSGRDKAADLWDCAAAVDGPFELNGLDLAALTERLCRPYGVAVRAEVDVGAPFGRFGIQVGETAWEAIERACRFRSVLPLSDGLGGLTLTRAGATRAPAALRGGTSDGTLLSGSGSFSQRGRFSLYVCKGQAEGAGQGLGPATGEREPVGEEAAKGAAEACSAEGRAEDKTVRRYRPTVLTAEMQGSGASLQSRAEWEARVAAGRSRRISATVQGWRAAGALWRPNALVRFTDHFLEIDRDLLIVAVRYALDDGGSTTELELALPDAFALEPGAEEPGLLGGGAP